MKFSSNTALATTVLAAVLAFVPGAEAKSAACSNATLRGHYSALLTGSVNGLPFAALDLVVSDGNGNISGTGTVVVNGTPMPTSFTAIYTVNSNCSGSFVSDTGTTEDITVSLDGSEVQIILTSTPLGSATVTGTAKNLADN
ncbi:MAG TPA: hypothetical protein VFA89_01960 [Terriglobales bacterium]|nr:hypothetical protein [Terriglobales bacterium]